MEAKTIGILLTLAGILGAVGYSGQRIYTEVCKKPTVIEQPWFLQGFEDLGDFLNSDKELRQERRIGE